MKLRISGNSIRLRLLRSEVTRLIELGHIEHAVCFGPDSSSVLQYGLEHEPGLTQVAVRPGPSELMIVLPTQQAKTWAATEQVGIYATVDLGRNGNLDIIVEKDFACLDLSDADNHDTFENPDKETTC